jgi:hypothetical protein
VEQSRSYFKILSEYGYWEAVYSIGLNYKLTSDIDPGEFVLQAKEIPTDLHKRLEKVANTLCDKSDGHNKFLRMIQVWAVMKAPRMFWQQADTYSVGVVKSSESTEHTLLKKPLVQEDFDEDMDPIFIEKLNAFIANKDLDSAKRHLPESFLQKRIVLLNYASIRGICSQRKSHRMKQWKMLVECFKTQLKHPELLQGVL